MKLGSVRPRLLHALACAALVVAGCQRSGEADAPPAAVTVRLPQAAAGAKGADFDPAPVPRGAAMRQPRPDPSALPDPLPPDPFEAPDFDSAPDGGRAPAAPRHKHPKGTAL